MTPTGESAVIWNQPAAVALFQKIKSDQWTKHRHKHGHQHGHQASSGSSQGSVWQAKTKTAAQAACH
jgi:hypothetical protein